MEVIMNETTMMMPFEGHPVRFVGTPEKLEWVAADVCSVLGLTNPAMALSGLKSFEKGLRITDTLGGPQELLTIYEPGLYRLIFRSRKPEAERFQLWVFNTVLPTIRRTGSFGMSSELAAAQAQVAALAEINEKTASVVASILGKRGAQLRLEDKAFGAIERGQQLLLPDAGPIRTVPKRPKKKPASSWIPDSDLDDLLSDWARAFASKPVGVSEALEFARANDSSFLHLLLMLGDTPRAIGQGLRRIEGRRVGKLSFVAHRQRKRVLWSVHVHQPAHSVNGVNRVSDN